MSGQNKKFRLLNPAGKLIYVPGWAIQQLSKWHMLEWNRLHRCKQIKSVFFEMGPLLLNPDFKPMNYRAQDYSVNRSGRSPQSGRSNHLLQVLGTDLSGLNVPSKDGIRQLKRELNWNLKEQLDGPEELKEEITL
jgi:hypothetical protein